MRPDQPDRAERSERLTVESLDLEAQGIAHRADGKVVFIEGALPREVVGVQVNRQKDRWEQAQLVHLYRASAQRVKPHCPHFGLHTGACGGCKMQHIEPQAQLAFKQRALEDQIEHIGRTKPQQLLRPIMGPDWGYRYRARLSVRYVIKKDEVLIGFHERHSRYIADMPTCAVLPAFVSDLLVPLRALIKGLESRQSIPQIELACGESGRSIESVAARNTFGLEVALVLRHLTPLSAQDQDALRCFAAAHSTPQNRIQWWLQPKSPETAHPLPCEDGTQPNVADLHYTLPEFGARLDFKPTDFTQVNPFINEVLVSRALRSLDVQANERVIDWFCGLGNFTLPLATRAEHVLGVEGSEALVARAHQNMTAFAAARSTARAPTASAEFVACNLFDMTAQSLCAYGSADKWLIDPPRDGAFALVKALSGAIYGKTPEGEGVSVPSDWSPPKRIVYVSCNPSTLARDINILVNVAGYQLSAAGAVNMFPHTAHVESMAVFDRPKTQA